jgi:hypothetical protein
MGKGGKEEAKREVGRENNGFWYRRRRVICSATWFNSVS